ncbi:MAG: 2-C-methyl-D-erythritol 4-phosphate cytidylyltransferase [Verrucomicrobiae bacterium]|nr:2-C-methyl-D-erythritol 4-phosphate cytidylyltransferase [Verrucomicrobiae bacterium]
MTSAVIVAAGSSRRMGFDKLAVELAGVPVLARSIRAFQDCEAIDRIIVVTADDRIAEVSRQCKDSGISKLHAVVAGAAERHLSVHCGLVSAPTETRLVAVHDGARPLVTPASITRCIEAALVHRAASLAHRVADTLKRADESARVTDSVSREHLWAMETPQAFEFELLKTAYERILDSGDLVTDEVSAVQALGESIQLVENFEPNPKITVPADIVLAEAILAARG